MLRQQAVHLHPTRLAGRVQINLLRIDALFDHIPYNLKPSRLPVSEIVIQRQNADRHIRQQHHALSRVARKHEAWRTFPVIVEINML
ncbi:hypothetical protein D3C84_1047530 [compost metagenome]